MPRKGLELPSLRGPEDLAQAGRNVTQVAGLGLGTSVVAFFGSVVDVP